MAIVIGCGSIHFFNDEPFALGAKRHLRGGHQRRGRPRAEPPVAGQKDVPERKTVEAVWSVATKEDKRKRPFCRPGRRGKSPQWRQLSSRLNCWRYFRLNELLVLRGSLERSSGRLTAGNGLRDLVKIPGADKPLMPDRRVPSFRGPEFFFLQSRIGCHAFAGITVRQLKHAVIQRVEPSQCHELELVSHGSQFGLEFRNRRFVQLLLPVE